MQVTTASFIATIAIFSLGGYLVYRNPPKGPIQALGAFFGIALLFWLTTTAMKAWMPQYFAASVPAVQENYAPVFDMAAQTGMTELPGKAASLLGFSANSYSTGPTTDFVTGETTAVTQPTPDPNAGGGVPAAVPDAPAVVATAVPVDPQQVELTALYKRLDVAKNSNDRAALDSVLMAILTINPNDGVALEVQLDLQASEVKAQTLASLENLYGPNRGGAFWDIKKLPELQTAVYAAMRGGAFKTVDSGKSWNAFACQEWSTVEVLTNGFLKGFRFSVPRCYLEDYRGSNTGDVFQVN